MLGDIPGVTVKHVTDVTGRADVAFRFPFTSGVTEILLSASTHQFAGYVRDGIETVITKEVPASGPSSLTPRGSPSPARPVALKPARRRVRPVVLGHFIRQVGDLRHVARRRSLRLLKGWTGPLCPRSRRHDCMIWNVVVVVKTPMSAPLASTAGVLRDDHGAVRVPPPCRGGP